MKMKVEINDVINLELDVNTCNDCVFFHYESDDVRVMCLGKHKFVCNLAYVMKREYIRLSEVPEVTNIWDKCPVKSIYVGGK